MTEFTVNGEQVEVRDDHPHLLAALREELDITSPKDGCSPTGQCGCCTVLIDGKARVSCQTSMEKIAGSEVVTLEGFDQAEVDRMADAFAACGALQCGFCTPGIVVRTKALIDKNGADLTREQASRHLGAHLCRCTGYIKVLDAVEALAHDNVPVVVQPGGVGSRGVKYEGRELSVGVRDFIDDMRPDGMLHGALRLTDHARADIVGIDASKALEIEGVHAVYTAADIPAAQRVGIIHKDWPVMIPVGGRTSYRGDVLAIVVADTRKIARDAVELVEVTYDVLEPMVDPVRVVESDDPAVWELDGNTLSTSTYSRGDVDAALAESAFTVDEVFQTQRIEHAFLEPESTLAVPTMPADGSGDEPESLYVYSGGQGIWDDRNDIAAMLGIDTDRVTTELVSNGGAFGGKEDMSNQAHTALAAWKTGRPVKITLSREESLLMHPKRHPIRMHYQAGCDADGKLTAIKVRMIGDSGPYASVGMKVLERAAGHATGPYLVGNVDVEAVAVRTNNSVCGAFRGFGANQAQFAMEGVLERLAEQVGITGWEIRSRNVVTPGTVWGPGQKMDDGCKGARMCLDAVKPAYDEAMAAGKAVGMGLGLKNSGLGNGFKEIAKAVVHFLEPVDGEPGRVEVRHCWTEMGQGVHTVCLQVAVEELGIPAERIDVIVDSTRELGAGQTTGSRGTLMGAGSVKAACEAARADGCKVGVDYEGEYRVDWTSSLGQIEEAKAAGNAIDNPIIHSTFGYAAQVVVMDPETGEIENVIAAHDVGKAVNPMLCEGQIEGAVHMGLGYALSEGFPCDETGFPVNTTLRSLDIIRPKDMPPVDVILVESAQPDSPYGIKGVGEIGLVPTAGAVAGAIRKQSGEWHNELPMRNEANRERASAWT
ncbi:molybdopterin-dependent oxidoreductase [Ilumatobacter coccineus]|uniref:Putative oxidoreductase iron-sulfur subunit/oxidoreductase molybdopterin-binding subunit n=1 Tax=Ilumatobacter coccineus (strain NBRC 103263 / KCTC 29153 / YM16-304) TaxID=1313172 RepID=A0A6C7E1T1_ILUCY|nr:molybdopterin cofactor-binding domain-containing protein [Ilumatobacter coccineus]BAN00472.1 putative oxidoreductase iron-sulfur subunit/oxidoreductase molybdopterin-binding subunit [Ilumatobacter coccineus YM16-304]